MSDIIFDLLQTIAYEADNKSQTFVPPIYFLFQGKTILVDKMNNDQYVLWRLIGKKCFRPYINQLILSHQLYNKDTFLKKR